MTVTASATDRDLLEGKTEGGYNPSAPPGPSGYIVDAPLGFHLKLERTGAPWTVVDRETGIYGAGASPIDALADFRTAVLEHLDVLERQESLSAELARQLKYLRERVRRQA